MNEGERDSTNPPFLRDTLKMVHGPYVLVSARHALAIREETTFSTGKEREFHLDGCSVKEG